MSNAISRSIARILWLVPLVLCTAFPAPVNASTTNVDSVIDVLNDEFGYTIEEVAHEWTDASDGTEITNFQFMNYGAQVALPFTFPFYDRQHDSAIVLQNGSIVFDSVYIFNGQFYGLPSRESTNDFIAPFNGHWGSRLILNSASRLTHKIVGSAPNRRMIVQWTNFYAVNGSGPYTFQADLHENGDVFFHHHDIAASATDAVVGIEDSEGLVGVGKVFRESSVPANRTYRIRRPSPRARIDVMKPYSRGLFSPAGVPGYADFVIRNTGELGADTYDIVTSTLASQVWPHHFENQNGDVLADTNADGLPDTGLVAAGDTLTVSMVMTAPVGAAVGFAMESTFEFRSSLESAVTRTVQVLVSVPPRFVMMWNDGWEQRVQRSADNAFGSKVEGFEPEGIRPGTGIADIGNGRYALFDNQLRTIQTATGEATREEIHRIIVDNAGVVVSPRLRLINTREYPAPWVSDDEPRTARTSNGVTGMAWERAIYTAENQWIYEIYFGILSPDGFIVGTPSLAASSEGSADRIGQVVISAIDDNRFVVAWHRGTTPFYRIYDSSGSPVQATRAFVDGVSGLVVEDLAAYGNDSMTVLYRDLFGTFGSSGLYLQRITAAGQPISDSVRVTPQFGGTTLDADMVHFNDGRVVVVWRYTDYEQNTSLQFSVLDSDLNAIVPPTRIPRSDDATSRPLSILADDNRAFVVWPGQTGVYLASAFIGAGGDGAGQAEYAGPLAVSRRYRVGRKIDYPAAGITTFSGSVPAAPDPTVATRISRFGARPGNPVQIAIDMRNQGGGVADNLTLTVTLAPELTYLDDSTGMRPQIASNAGSQTLSWTFSTVRYLESQQILLDVGVPNAAYGTRYSVTGTLSTSGADETSANNTFTADAVVSYAIHVPYARSE